MRVRQEEFDKRAGKMIRELRRAREWSQEKLGDEVEVSFQQIQKYETGANRMSLFAFVQMVLALGGQPSAYVKKLGLEDSSANVKPR